MSNGDPGDLEGTRQQLRYSRPPVNGKNWLRHTIGTSAAAIDEMLLTGEYTIDQMADAIRALSPRNGENLQSLRGRVQKHLDHLRTANHGQIPHNLPLSSDNLGRWRFDIPRHTQGNLDWTDSEVLATVADYFSMLRDELWDRPYSKAEHNRELQQRLHNRSRASIEFKHQNISAVLDQRGLPYINGYKPRGNFQQLLADTIDQHLLQDPELLDLILGGSLAAEVSPPAAPLSVSDVLQDPPESQALKADQASARRRPAKIDFAARDSTNRALGLAGERFVVEFERQRLRESGRPDLADQVCHVSIIEGDGAGYDVRSFDEGGQPLHIEVKTTTLAKHVPFLVTVNEVQFSIDNPGSFRLYRVFAFRSAPGLYILQGPLKERCDLQPIAFRASILPHES